MKEISNETPFNNQHNCLITFQRTTKIPIIWTFLPIQMQPREPRSKIRRRKKSENIGHMLLYEQKSWTDLHARVQLQQMSSYFPSYVSFQTKKTEEGGLKSNSIS